MLCGVLLLLQCSFMSDNKVTQRAAQKLIQRACSRLGAGSVSQMISLYVILIYSSIIISYQVGMISKVLDDAARDNYTNGV